MVVSSSHQQANKFSLNRDRLWAWSPERKETAKICTIDVTIAVDVGLRQDGVDGSPEREHGTKIRAVNDLVVCDVGVLAGWTFTDVGDAVGVGVGELAVEDLAVVDDVVIVAVGGPLIDRSNINGLWEACTIIPPTA
ncbi:MAG: hypothetical protein RLZZ386_725, partial [Planctomycetota bacterium]